MTQIEQERRRVIESCMMKNRSEIEAIEQRTEGGGVPDRLVGQYKELFGEELE